MSLIIPTILTSDPKELARKLSLVKGITDLVQVDIVDGVFAPAKTIGLNELLDRSKEVGVELHLMVDRPEDWIEEVSKVRPASIVAQIEMMEDPDKYFTLAAELGIRAGIAIDLPTKIDDVAPEIFVWTEKIVLMAVKAGIGGQKFDGSVLDKIGELRDMGVVGPVNSMGGTSWVKEMGVDGGLNEETIGLCAEAGVREFCVGTAFWEADDLLKRYQELEYSAMNAGEKLEIRN